MNSKELVAQMSLEEKASLCSGLNFWQLKGIERLGLPSIMVTDGPHGLRKQTGQSDQLGINESVPATCFPTACATACAFDPDLMHEVGVALGEECQQEDVAVILGPGANIKRSPLCGRNFEYISEDPYVTGELAAALINGVQSQGVGTSIKHYAANNQETRRMTTDSAVDERALREIYLPGFEAAVKKAQPWTVMCSYNLLDGTYLSNNKRMLDDILRKEWGFAGLVMTDWGAMDDRVAGIAAGLDLEMPATAGVTDKQIIQAVQDGSLPEAELDTAAARVVALIQKYQANHKEGYRYDAQAHHALARKVAAQSTVLLKNKEEILPLKKETTLAVIGAFAKTPRYQGAGSSRINPPQIDCAYDALLEAGFQAEYADGYVLKDDGTDAASLRKAACEAAVGKDVVLLFAGLPDAYESEGFDRTSLDMPQTHNDLIAAVAAVNPNVVVVLQCGAPVTMPWADTVKGIVLSYLGGQAGGSGCADVLTGKVNPGAKLAESFPKKLEDTPSYKYFPGYRKSVEYRESIFVGYRYYDKVEKDVLFPFGYGLSYTSFAYSDLKLSQDHFAADDTLTVSCSIENTGSVAGAEVAQLYVGLPDSKIFRALRELKGFQKVFLAPGERKEVTFTLDARSFSYYNVPAKDWAIEGGSYVISVGGSSRDLRLTADVAVTGDGKEDLLAERYAKLPAYFDLAKEEMTVPEKQFEILYGKPLPPREHVKGEPFTENSTLDDIQDTLLGKIALKAASAGVEKMMGDSEDMRLMAQSMLRDMRLRGVLMLGSDKLTMGVLEGLVSMANGKYVKGIGKMFKK